MLGYTCDLCGEACGDKTFIMPVLKKRNNNGFNLTTQLENESMNLCQACQWNFALSSEEIQDESKNIEVCIEGIDYTVRACSECGRWVDIEEMDENEVCEVCQNEDAADIVDDIDNQNDDEEAREDRLVKKAIHLMLIREDLKKLINKYSERALEPFQYNSVLGIENCITILSGFFSEELKEIMDKYVD